MKLFLDFFPIVIFFIVYKVSGNDLIMATAILIPATMLQMAYTWLTAKRIEKMQWVTLVMVVFFGGMTVLFKDGIFIKWKPTVVNGLFALVFLASQFVGNKPVIQRLLESGVQLPQQAWRRLNMAWVIFFVLIGIINLYVAFHFSEATWVNFKLFGMLGLTLAFIVIQGFYIARFMKHHLPSNVPEEER
jgi:intracellular septation protein